MVPFSIKDVMVAVMVDMQVVVGKRKVGMVGMAVVVGAFESNLVELLAFQNNVSH